MGLHLQAALEISHYTLILLSRVPIASLLDHSDRVLPAMTIPPNFEDSAHGAVAATQALKEAAIAELNKDAPSLEIVDGRPVEAPLVPGTEEYKLHLPQTEIVKEDVNTKDEWVPR